MSASTFGDFYRQLGFAEYPFSLFSSENEGDKGSNLFITTSMYGPIIEGFLDGRTMIMVGDRGSGKTAIILDFLRRSAADSSTKKLIVNIDDFSGLKIDYAAADLYKFTIEAIAKGLFEKIAENSVSVRKLSHEDKVSLSSFLHHFVPTHTKEELKRKIESIQIGSVKRFFAWSYRFLRVPANIGINVATNFLSDLLSKSLGTATPNATEFRDYLPDINLAAQADFNDADASYGKLKELISLARRLGFAKVVCILDKIDEDPRFSNAAEEISAFIEPIVTDTKYLLDKDFQVVVSLWIIPFNMLRDKVRTQKVYCPVLDWSSRDLESALDRRTSVFSNGKLQSFRTLLASDVTSDQINYMFTLANKNPRDLWHLIDKILHAQYSSGKQGSPIDKDTVQRGFDNFVGAFNFYEYYPRKANSKASSMDVYGYIKHLLKLKSHIFTRNQLNEAARTGSSTQNYCVSMESIGLIEKDGSSGGNIVYRIRDPKVVHAIQNNMDISKNA